ncbi:M15 family metallopeptidase [uncultured Paraglaciecola sp.]|uniref:M15 family metallopeptidase n=1 Tax=uncultured Paraglaciecola sp. TaxID=1765024 RepID=UPI0030DCADC3
MKNIIAFVALVSLHAQAENKMPEQFVILNHTLTTANYDIRYATNNNFVGRRVDGYKAPLCIIERRAAKALAVVNSKLVANQMRLKIFDCYRPEKAVDHFMRWVNDDKDQMTKENYYPNLEKLALKGGYIAERSGHSRGFTIDLTIESLNKNGEYKELDMGAPYDFFDSISNTHSDLITESQLENRLKLKTIMLENGFKDYSMEWWHFTHSADPQSDYWNFDVAQ